MDMSVTGMRVLRQVAERGSFTAAAADLDYTQSAVSRQVAALERAADATLFDRTPGGVRLTAAGLVVLRHARVVLDEIDATRRELHRGEHPPAVVHLGAYVSAGATLVPAVVAEVHRRDPGVRVVTREGTTPGLVRSVRAGTIDVAVITSRPPHRPPDDELPRLKVETLDETDLVVAASAIGPFAGRMTVTIDELEDVDWIASPSSGGDPLLGVWPGLAGRPRVAHQARDWLTKLRLVAAGCGMTTVTPDLAACAPAGIIALQVLGAPAEQRRTSLVRMPGRPGLAATAVIEALRAHRRTTPA